MNIREIPDNKKQELRDAVDGESNVSVPVSVIIPAYNSAAFLGRAVESVLEQTLDGIEIIVVDDGSTDATAETARAFGDRVRYLRQENGGIASARNLGLSAARGEFIASLDSDDYFILPAKLERQVDVMRRHGDCGLVLTGWMNVDAEGREIEKREPWNYAARLDLRDMVTWSPFLPSVMLFRRSALDSVGGFDPKVRIIEDFDIVTRLIMAGYTAKWVPEIGTAYRLHTENITRNLPAMERETEEYLAKFFSDPALPANVRTIERKVRFSSRIRMAFKYFEANDLPEMKRCLLRSTEFSDLTRGGRLLYWIESFRGYDPNLNVFKLMDSEPWRELADLQLASAP